MLLTMKDQQRIEVVQALMDAGLVLLRQPLLGYNPPLMLS